MAKTIRHSLKRQRQQRGSSLVEMAFLLPILLLLVLVAVDFGRAYFVTIEVANAARAGAQYGMTQPSDTTGMQFAATADASDVAGMTAVATSGCMCADGSGSSQSPCGAVPPVCGASTRLVNFVTINTQVVYVPLFAVPGVMPAAGLTIKGKATFMTGT